MMKSNLKGAAGVQINIRDVSGRPNTRAATYRIGLVGWTPKGPSNTPIVISSENELHSIFGTPKDYKPHQVYLLHNAKIILNSGAEVVIVRTVEALAEETLNYGVYIVGDPGQITSPVGPGAPIAISYNMSNVILNKKNLKLVASTNSNSPFTMFLKYPGFKDYHVSIQTFESDIASISTSDFENNHTLNTSPSDTHYSTDRASFKSYVQGLGLYEDAYSVPSMNVSRYLKPDVAGTYYKHADGTYSTTVATPVTTRYSISTLVGDVDRFIVYETEQSGVYVDSSKVELFGDAYKDGEFYKLNKAPLDVWEGTLPSQLPDTIVKNDELNKFLKMFVIVRVFESKSSQTALESIFATIDEYVTASGDQLDITSAFSNLLTFKRNAEFNFVSGSVVDSGVSKTVLTGGSVSGYRRDTKALESAWGMFADTTTVEVSLLVDGGSSIVNFGNDRENDSTETGDLAVVTAMLKASSARMDAPCILDLPKRANVNQLLLDFKKYPSIGNEVEGSTAPYATFWGNAQDGRQIVNDSFNKKQIEVARSVFKALVAYNVFTRSHPWQTQWGPNRGLITAPSVGTINPRTYPDEVGLLSQNRINPSRLTTTGEYFWDDYTLMAKSSVLQRWHAVCFLANLNKRYRKLLEQYVAELNTPALRKTIWNMLNDDLNYIANHADPAGLYNYYVICDETNNTPDVIDSGKLNVDIGLEIVRDTRVINLTTTLYRTGGIIESGISV